MWSHAQCLPSHIGRVGGVLVYVCVKMTKCITKNYQEKFSLSATSVNNYLHLLALTWLNNAQCPGTVKCQYRPDSNSEWLTVYEETFQRSFVNVWNNQWIWVCSSVYIKIQSTNSVFHSYIPLSFAIILPNLMLHESITPDQFDQKLHICTIQQDMTNITRPQTL